MCILPNPLCIPIEAINIVIFLLLWRIISMGHYGHQLKRIKERLEDLLESFNTGIDRLWYRMTQKRLSQRGQLLVGILLLSFGQLFLYRIAGLL